MRIELLILCLAVVLGFLHIVLASHSASLQRGYRWTASARDEVVPPLTGVAGRLARAATNYLETFPYFVALLFAVHATNSYGELSKWGVLLYLGARVAYLPLYAFGVFLVRSLVWNVATFGLALMMAAVLAQFSAT